MPCYRFAPMTAADLPLVRRWLTMPHVIEWWGDPEEQFELVSGDLAEPAMDQFIVALDEKPLAYLQCYNPEVWPRAGWVRTHTEHAVSISSLASLNSSDTDTALPSSAASPPTC